MSWWLVLATLWMINLAMLPGFVNGFSMPKLVLWMLGSLLVLATQWWTPSLRGGSANRWMSLIFAWISLLFLWQNFWGRLWIPENFEATVAYRWVTSTIIPTMVCWISLLMVDFLVRQKDSTPHWARIGLHCCAIGGVLAVYGLSQAIGLDPFELGARSGTHNITPKTIITVYGNPMLTANALAIFAPFCLIFKPRWCRVVYGLILLNLYLIQSISSLAGCLIGSSVIWGFRRQWKAFGILGLFIVVGVVWLIIHHQFTAFVSFEHRDMMWKTAWDFWKGHPWNAWMGYGLGSVEALTTNHYWNYGTLHCEPLQILFETGVVGGVFCIGWAFRIARRLWVMPKDTLKMGWVASGVSYAIVACTSFPLRMASLLFMGILIVSVLETFGEEASHAKVHAA